MSAAKQETTHDLAAAQSYIARLERELAHLRSEGDVALYGLEEERDKAMRAADAMTILRKTITIAFFSYVSAALASNELCRLFDCLPALRLFVILTLSATVATVTGALRASSARRTSRARLRTAEDKLAEARRLRAIERELSAARVRGG
jgi:hypothetical protein